MSEKIITNNEGSAIARIKKRSMLKKQRAAIVLMAVAVALLIAALFAVNYLIGIYVYPDVDGTEYHIRKINGIYELCYKNGDVLDLSSEGYYQTDIGTLVAINPQTGDWSRYAVVDIEGTEVLDYGQKVLIFKELTYDMESTKDMSKVIKSIEVHNSYGEFKFIRHNSTENKDLNNYFYIDKHDKTDYDLNSLAQLAVSCGYTISMLRLENPVKLENGEIDYSEYGLTEETRTKTETDENGKEIEIKYDYEPAWYVITTMTGESHKVYIGDMTATGTGYYAKYEGRDTIYVLSDAENSLTGKRGFTDIVLEKIEKMITPTIVSPMGATTYYNVSKFTICNIDYDSIYKTVLQDINDKYGPLEEDALFELIEKLKDDEEFKAFYEQSWENAEERFTRQICNFSYVDMNERQNTLNSYMPYESHLSYNGGYYINSSNIDIMLYALYATEFTGVEVFDPTDEDLENYGLYDAPYTISFFYKTTDDKGKDILVENFVCISEKNENGIFYAYSPAENMNMIVGVSESSFGFLEWEEIDWYDKSYIQLDISYVENIIIESPGFKTNFTLEDSASRYMTYIAQSGKSFKDGEDTYNIVWDSKTGKYVLSKGGKNYSPIYTGDYLVTPLIYQVGQAQSSNYLFVETKSYDVDEDGTDDATAYYFYNIGYEPTSKEYRLLAQVALADQSGNKIGEDELIWGQPVMTTDYFVTNSGYVYLTGKDTHIGQQLEETYGKKNRGEWAQGSLFLTTDGQYVLVNSKTGEWSVMDNVSCNIYFADRYNSRLAQRAVKIPEVVKDGKVTRYEETYYPTTTKNLKLDLEAGKIMVVNKDKTLQSATYADCTIGTWSSGSYFKTESGLLVVINGETGNWGFLTVSNNESYVCEVFADETLLDYVIKTTNHVNRLVDTTAMENFQQFYGGLLHASIEGMADLTEEEMAALRQHDDFYSGENGCQLKITIMGCDFLGNRRDIVYRFYQLPGMKSYITIEVLGEDGVSSSENAYGSFYVLRTFADKIISDAKKMLAEEEIDAVTKY